MTMAFYTLVAFPASKTRLKNFFSEDGASPGWLLTAAPRLRPAGFDLSTSGYAHLVDGEYWGGDFRGPQTGSALPGRNSHLSRARRLGLSLGVGSGSSRFCECSRPESRRCGRIARFLLFGVRPDSSAPC